MLKKSIIKTALYDIMIITVIVLCVIVCLNPFNAFALVSYETNATDTNGVYEVVDNGVTINSYAHTTDEGKAVDQMRQKALLRWTYPGQTQTYYYPKYGSSTPNKIYLYHWNDEQHTTIQQYRGILYEQKVANYQDMQEASREHWLNSDTAVESAISIMLSKPLPGANEDETLSLRRSVQGTDCSSSVCYAWRAATGCNNRTCGVLMSTLQHSNQFCYTYTCAKIVKDGYDDSFNNVQGYGNYVDYVGNYTPGSSYTDVNIGMMGTNIYSNVYVYMKPGDLLVQYTEEKTHARIIEKVVIERNNDNSINPYKSYVVVTEQTSSKKHCTNTAYSLESKKFYDTTWYVAYSGGKYNSQQYPGVEYNYYNFYHLAGQNNSGSKTFYLPFRCKDNLATLVTGFVPIVITDSEIDINWNEQKSEYCNGYELVYATNVSFSDAKTLVFNNPHINNCSLKNLKRGETYYIKMRAFVYHEDGRKEYSGYNNWLRINTATKEIYRENAPNPREVLQQEYKEYVYDDISYDYDLDY
ncbi:MAG: hypothetical protein E7570_03730 [Ruminococcaceae bacterium]|nr:hypothetical protein [Oscillospiraceae bacterium]